jgi:hypothetical protein
MLFGKMKPTAVASWLKARLCDAICRRSYVSRQGVQWCTCFAAVEQVELWVFTPRPEGEASCRGLEAYKVFMPSRGQSALPSTAANVQHLS